MTDEERARLPWPDTDNAVEVWAAARGYERPRSQEEAGRIFAEWAEARLAGSPVDRGSSR